MKYRTKFLQTAAVTGWLMVCASVLSAAAATNKTVVARARTAAVAAPTISPVTEQTIPRSSFAVPRKIAEGKDPFFPNSTRIYNVGISAPTNGTPTIVADLTLKGISGTTEQPLAIINSTTFTTGETNEVIIKNGRIKVLCLEINMSAGTVLLQIGGERRELRLQALK